MRRWQRENRDGDERGIAPVVGLVFLLGVVAIGTVAIFVAGTGAISDVSTEADTEQAVSSLRAASYDLDSRGYAETELPNEGSSFVDPDAGWMRIEVGNETVVSQSEGRLGALYYENDQSTVAYQGGGVWRTGAGNRSVMASPPPFDYTRHGSPTLTLPVVSLTESNGDVGRDRLSTVETRTRFPASENVSNPITENVTVTVHSEFYRGWGDYFEQRFDDVSYDHGAQEVRVTLQGGDDVSQGNQTGSSGDDSGIGGLIVNDGDELDLAQDAYLDSYDSGAGSYTPGSAGEQGDVAVTGEFLPSNDVEVHGDVDATGPGDLANGMEVTGNVTLGPGYTSGANDAHVGGHLSVEGDAGVSQNMAVDRDLIVGGQLDTLGGTYGEDVHVHGADSTIGDGGSGVEIDGNVYGGDDVEITDAVIHGDVFVDGDVEIASSATIDGNVTATGTISGSTSAVAGSTQDGAASVPAPRDPIEPDVPVPDPDVDVDQKGSELQSDNDNGDTPHVGTDVFGNTELQNCGTGGPNSGCELTAGQYYLDEIDLRETSGGFFGSSHPERLELDTSDGPIEIYVAGDVTIEDPATVEVVYDGDQEHAATIYTGGDFRLKRGAAVEIADDRTPVFEVFVKHDGVARVEGGSTFRGGLYGLEEGGDRTEIDLSPGNGPGNQLTEFYGAMLGDIDNFDQDARFHYDTDMRNGRLSERTDDDDDGEDVETSEAEVVYLHVDQKTVETG